MAAPIDVSAPQVSIWRKVNQDIFMKSFSSSSFASDHSLALEAAYEAVQKDPRALFTNFQWFLFTGKDTIFFTAFSSVTAVAAALLPFILHA